MLDQTILFVMTETALAHDTHDNSEIELSGLFPFYLFGLCPVSHDYNPSGRSTKLIASENAMS